MACIFVVILTLISQEVPEGHLLGLRFSGRWWGEKR